MTTASTIPGAFKLHLFQDEAKAAIRKAWADGTPRPAVILPTGAGKTVVFSSLVRELHDEGRRSVVLVHRDELVDQTVAKLAVFSGLSDWTVGVVKAERHEDQADVIVASVQTLYRNGRLDKLTKALASRPFTVVYDEVHHATSVSNRRVLGGLGVLDVAGTQAVGFTATFTRTDSKHLANDWTPCFEKTVAWAIEHGFLCDLEAISVRVPDLELDHIRSADGDMGDKALGQALINSGARHIIPAKWLEHAKGRPTILFAPTVASCEDLVDGLMEAGIKTEAVYGTTASAERHAIYDRVRTGATSILASVGVLTEGFDMPAISCAILARPTESRGLYQQMVGRVLRTFPGKDNALLLDVIGSTTTHTLANVTDLTRTHDGKVADEDKAPAKCVCTGLCMCETRGNCTRTKNLELCLCDGCDCPRSGERGAIKLVKGAADVHVDVFKGSDSVWLRSYAGTWFIPTRDTLVAVLPTDGELYRPARTHDARTAGGTRMAWLGPVSDLTTAMAQAERYAAELDPHIVARGSAWRRRKPSQPQAKLAKDLGIQVEDGTKAGPISDAISTRFGSQTLAQAGR